MTDQMKRFAVLVLALAVFVLLCGTAGAEPLTGECGDNLTWTLENQVLTISGTGPMWDFTDETPWPNDFVSVQIGDDVTSIGSKAFSNVTMLTDVTIPANVKSIGEGAFSYGYDLASITIPDGVESIGTRAFYDTGLTGITIPGSVKSIGEEAFGSCLNLTDVTIQEGVTGIGEAAFWYCIRLKSVSIPEGVTSIGAYAFSECSSLESIRIPRSVTSIGEGTFFYCDSLAAITVAAGNTAYASLDGVLFTADMGTLILYPAGITAASCVIPDGVKCIGEKAFPWNTSLKSVTMPDTVTEIWDNTFRNWSDIAIAAPCTSYALSWAENHNISSTKIHGLQRTAAVKATCTKAGNSAYWTCRTCGRYFSDSAGKTEVAKNSWVIAALGHKWKTPTYTWAKDKGTVTAKQVCARNSSHVISEKVKTTYKVTKKPTYTATGIGLYTSKVFTKSKDFKVQTKKVTLDKLPRTPITRATITAIDDQVYTGSAIKPSLTIKYNNKKLVKGTDYTVSFKDNVKPGKATVTITGKNAYKGKTTVTFIILPKKVKLVSLKPGKAKITVTWKKGAGVTGYEIMYSLKKSFSGSTTVTVASASTVTTKITGLKPGKTYYVRIRAYKKVGTKMYYSEWSDKLNAAVPAE